MPPKKSVAINNARIAAAKGRAKEIFAEYSSDSDSEEVKGLKQELQQLRAKVQSLTPPDNPGMCTHLSHICSCVQIDNVCV